MKEKNIFIPCILERVRGWFELSIKYKVIRTAVGMWFQINLKDCMVWSIEEEVKCTYNLLDIKEILRN